MSDGRIILVGGGVRSGKSAFAVSLAHRLAPPGAPSGSGFAAANGLGARRAFIATARPYDDEMRDRIARHQAERGAAFQTIEEPVALAAVLRRIEGVDVVVVDCLTLWLSNLLIDGLAPDLIDERVEELAGTLAERRFHAVLVTNEVGMGVHPETTLGRVFRDLAGRAHQRLARRADEIHFAVLGVILRLKPEPVAIQASGGHT